MPGHYDGRLKEAIDVVINKAKSVPNEDGKPGYSSKGEFYQIFKKYDFFDTSDKDNKLTPVQRAMIPNHARYRYTQFADAIADMIKYVLAGNETDNIGVLTVAAEDIVKKLDARSAMNASATEALSNTMTVAASGGGNPVAANPALGTGKTIKQIKEYLTGFAMGLNPFHPDMIPPIMFGLDGINSLGALGNLYQVGFFQPDWDVLYEEETPSKKFYSTGEGGLKIGTDIDVSEGSEIYRKTIFGVINMEKDLEIKGNLRGGLTIEQYQVIEEAAKLEPEQHGIIRIAEPAQSATSTSPKKEAVYEINDSEYEHIRNFELTEDQMRASFYSYMSLKYWDAIKNPNNWAYGHWGALANNALPGGVRTAIMSYIRTNGLALEKDKSDDAAFVSYLITIGLYYYIGYNHPVRMKGIKGFDKGIDENGKIIDMDGSVSTEGSDVAVGGLPKDVKKAERYWTWAADFLSRLTRNSNGEGVGFPMRRRRVTEANLIYKQVGLPEIPFGQNLALLPFEHSEQALIDRDFDKIIEIAYAEEGVSWYRYGNTGAAGADESGELKPQTPTAKLNFAKQKDKKVIERYEASENLIRYLLDQAGVSSATITRTISSAAGQASAMFDNLNAGKEISYKPAGRAVTNVYKEEKGKLGLGTNVRNGLKITNPEDIKRIKDLMAKEVNNQGPSLVSRHCGNEKEFLVFDIAPSSVKFLRDYFKESKSKTEKEVAHSHFINTFLKATSGNGSARIKRFLYPHKYADRAQRNSPDDPAYHIEIEQSIASDFETSDNDALPSVDFKLTNTNYSQRSAWNVPFVDDNIVRERLLREGSDIVKLTPDEQFDLENNA